MSKQPERKPPAIPPPAAARRPPSGAPARPPVSGTSRPASGPRPGATGGAVQKSAGARPPKLTTSRPVAPPSSRTLRPLDLALITAGILVVGVLIWFATGGLNNNNNNNAAAPATTGTTNALATAPPASSAPTLDPTVQAIFDHYNQTPVPAGQPAPAFTLPGIDGKTYALADFKGKVVLLEFMAMWCPHCQDDAPLFNQIHTQYQSKANVQFLGINASPYGHNYQNGDNSRVALADITWFHDTFQVSYPMLFDPDVQTASAYGVTRFPTVFIVGKDGNISSQIANPPDAQKLTTALDKALGGSAAPGAGR